MEANYSIKDAKVAVSVFDTVTRAYMDQMLDSYEMLDQMNFRRPWPIKELKKKRQGWRSNTPHGKSLEMMTKFTENRAKIFVNAIKWGCVKLNSWSVAKHGNDKDYSVIFKPHERRVWQDLISSAVKEELLKSNAVMKLLNNVAFQQVGWGYAMVVQGIVSPVKSLLGYIPHVLCRYVEPTDNFETVSMTVDTYAMPIAMIYDEWKRLEGKEDVKSFWNIEGLREVLLEHFKNNLELFDNAKATISNMEATWSMAYPFINGANVSSYSTSVRIARFIKAEPTGGVSVVLWVCGNGQNDVMKLNLVGGGKQGAHLLYQRFYPNKELKDFVTFIQDIGFATTTTVARIKGVSRKCYHQGMSDDLNRNGVDDKAKLAAATWLSSDGGDTAKFEYYGSHVVTDQSTVLSPEGMKAASAIPPLLNYLNYQDQQFKRDTDRYDISISDNIGDRATNNEVNSVGQEVASKNSKATMTGLKDLEGLLNVALQGLLVEQKNGRFVENVVTSVLESFGKEPPTEEKEEKEMRDLVKKILKEFKEVVLNTSVLDSTAIRDLLERTNEATARRKLERRYAASLGCDNNDIDDLFPELDSSVRSIADNSLAMIENDMFFSTGEVAYSGGQDAITHLASHLGKAQALIDSVGQGEDPVKVARWWGFAVSNIVQHLQDLQKIPYQKKDFEKLKEAFDLMGKAVAEVMQKAQAMAKAVAQQEQEQQGQGGDIEDEKARHKMQLNEQNSEWRRGIKEQEFAASADRKAKNFELQQQLTLEKAKTDLAIKKANGKVKVKKQTKE